MRFAVNLPPFTDARTLVDMGVAAEAAGWDAVFVWDHLQLVPGLDTHDPWALLSAMAVRTERVLLGTAITPLSRRRPQVLAKQVTTLDHLSGGRAVLGVGLGEPPDGDFEAFGDSGDPNERAARLDEALTIVDGLLRGDRVDHDGEHFTVHAQLHPGSVQQPRVPIFVAGVVPNRRPRDRALRWDGFHPIDMPELATPDAIRAYLDGADRPDDWQVYAVLHPDHAVAEFEAVGVDWLVEGAWPEGDWVAELTDRIEAGPPR